MAQMRIFLSHSSTDRDFADALAKALRDVGADVWYDESHLGTGQLLDEISAQLPDRPTFLVILSKAAFASKWVKHECKWAFNLYEREPERIILPIVAQNLDPADWNAMLWLEGFRRVAASGGAPYPHAEAIQRTLRLLSLAPESNTTSLAPTQSAERRVEQSTGTTSVNVRGSCWNCGKPNPSGFAVCSHCGVTLDLLEQALRPNTDHSPTPPVAHPLLEHRNTGNPVSVTRPTNPDTQESDDYLIERGKALSIQIRFSEAKTLLERATRMEPKNFDAWFNLGVVCNAMNRWRDGLEAWDRATQLDPSSPRAWTKRGQAQYHLRYFQDALRSFEAAIVLDPLDGECWYSKSLVLRTLGQDEEAKLMERLAHDLDE